MVLFLPVPGLVARAGSVVSSPARPAPGGETRQQLTSAQSGCDTRAGTIQPQPSVAVQNNSLKSMQKSTVTKIYNFNKGGTEINDRAL